MKRGRVPLTVSVPPEIAGAFNRTAKLEAKNKSQLFRDMFQTYQQRRREDAFFELQGYGTRKARKQKIYTEDEIDAMVLRDR